MDDALRRVNAEQREHVRRAIETLSSPEKLRIESHLTRVDDSGPEAERLIYASTGDDNFDTTADIVLMNQTFTRLFSRPRSDSYSKRLKESARQAIVAKFKEFKLETLTQSFTAQKRGKVYKGSNLIGN